MTISVTQINALKAMNLRNQTSASASIMLMTSSANVNQILIQENVSA